MKQDSQSMSRQEAAQRIYFKLNARTRPRVERGESTLYVVYRTPDGVSRKVAVLTVSGKGGAPVATCKRWSIDQTALQPCPMKGDDGKEVTFKLPVASPTEIRAAVAYVNEVATAFSVAEQVNADARRRLGTSVTAISGPGLPRA